jgi:hypothetical protein
MAKYMYSLGRMEKKFMAVCPACAKRGEVIDDCRTCHGNGTIRKRALQYYVRTSPIEIVKVDRDPQNGILRYWEDKSNFCYETTTHELNEYVPDIPYGVHLLHEDKETAHVECDRINKYLKEKAKKAEQEADDLVSRFRF